MRHLLLVGLLAVPVFAQPASAPAPSSDAMQEGPAEQPVGPPPSEPPPELVPPPPPVPVVQEGAEVAPPPPSEPQSEIEAPPAGQSGQWVSTAQYGWVWMPYGANYSYAPSYGVSYSYVYYPTYGWRWVSAPWVWGIGTRPYFVAGPRYYHWYHPTYWSPGYRWGVSYGGYGRPWVAPVYRVGIGYGEGFRGGPVYRGRVELREGVPHAYGHPMAVHAAVPVHAPAVHAPPPPPQSHSNGGGGKHHR